MNNPNNKSAVVETRHGFSVVGNSEDRTTRILSEHGEFEPHTTHIFRSLLNTGDCVVDGGANIGYFTLLAAVIVGESGQIHSFEPSPLVNQQLQENVRFNGFDCVTVWPLAILDRTGKSEFFEGPIQHTGVSSLRKIPEAARHYSVETVQLDHVLLERQVDLIKLDIEGAELAALKGMQKTLTRCRPSVVCEVTEKFFQELGTSSAELFAYMKDLGYQAWKIGGRRLEEIGFPSRHPNSQCNVLFTHSDRRDLERLLACGYQLDSRQCALRPPAHGKRAIFFSMHGDSAVEISELCLSAGIQIDLAPAENGLIRTNITEEERIQLNAQGVGVPQVEEMIRCLKEGHYDAVIVTTSEQVLEFHRAVRPLDDTVRLIVRHGNNIFEKLKRLDVKNFMSPSQRALVEMGHCETFQHRKLLAWSSLPAISDVSVRDGSASFIHHYEAYWPDAFGRFQKLNELLKPYEVMAHGVGNPAGHVDDVTIMNRSRATVHIKDAGICCFAITRSMAMGTPVLMDRLSWDRCYMDSTPGVIVCDTIEEIATELIRLQEDDSYWQRASDRALEAAFSQFTRSEDLAIKLNHFFDELQI